MWYSQCLYRDSSLNSHHIVMSISLGLIFESKTHGTVDEDER